jgi:hypothetical protein
MLERSPHGAVWKKFRKSVPLIMAEKYVAVQKRHPHAAHKGYESLNIGERMNP